MFLRNPLYGCFFRNLLKFIYTDPRSVKPSEREDSEVKLIGFLRFDLSRALSVIRLSRLC